MLYNSYFIFPTAAHLVPLAPRLGSVSIIFFFLKNPSTRLTLPRVFISPSPSRHRASSQHNLRLQLGEILCTYVVVNWVCSHYLMWSRREPSQQWHAAGEQGYLTGIDGKNCTQIINLGHPHATKKVTHIKTTHLFELYISLRAVNRPPRCFWAVSTCLN